MLRTCPAVLALAASAVSILCAQVPQTSPAPIVRAPRPGIGAQHESMVSEPVPGVRVFSTDPLRTNAAAEPDSTELRLEHGRVTVQVHAPAPDTLILFDLPGGQVDLVSDGTYTLNADTDTLRVLHGEARVFAPGADENSKGTAVREGEQVVLTDPMRPRPASSAELRADLLKPGGRDSGGSWTREYGYVPGPPIMAFGPGWVDPFFGGWYGGPWVGPAFAPWYSTWAWYPGAYAGGWGPAWGWGGPWFGAGLGWYGGFGGGYGGWRGGYDGFRGGHGRAPARPGGFHPGFGGGGFGSGRSGSGFHPGVSAQGGASGRRR